MRKFFKILLINLCLLAFFILTIEFVIWSCENLRVLLSKEEHIGKLPFPFHPGVRRFELVDLQMFNNPKAYWVRRPEGLNYKKGSIVIFGCSFAFGFDLENKQSFSYKLSHLTKRPVYNRAQAGWSIQHMLNQVRQSDFFKDVPEPEYVIYVMINDHFRRLYVPTFMASHLIREEQNLRYKYQNGELIQKKEYNEFIKFIQRLYLSQKTEHFYINNILLRKNNYPQYFNFALEHFIESKKEMQKHWKNTKYIVLLYQSFDNDELFIKKLQENGFMVISLRYNYLLNLSKPEYELPNFHPNEKAWDLVTSKIIGTLNL